MPTKDCLFCPRLPSFNHKGHDFKERLPGARFECRCRPRSLRAARPDRASMPTGQPVVEEEGKYSARRPKCNFS